MEYEIVVSTNPMCLQWSFDVLIRLFERLGLHTNVAKTVAMVCQSETIYWIKSTATYGQRMTVKGGSHPVRQLQRAVYKDCGI